MEEEIEVQSKVTVAVRVKPLDKDDRVGELCVYPHEQSPSSTIVVGSGTRSMRGTTTFTFDYCHWSLGEHPVLQAHPNPPKEATQASIYEDIGAPVVKNALHGFNCSIFAYGQTGSGKTFTMMGVADEGASELRGLIPRISEALFTETLEASGEEQELSAHTPEAAAAFGRFTVSHHFTVSYIEIYMEKVQDLLVDDDMVQTLRVREHPKSGPYVEGVTTVAVSNFEDIRAIIDRGNLNRATASTSMNSVSSRSHAVFTIQYTKRKKETDTGALLDTTSKLNLIDLAGSESAGTAGTTGERLKEGSYINKSLLTLGMVIKALAERNSRAEGKPKLLVPYRDSVLTFLLRDSLGGNSRTTMVATVRPGVAFSEETLSTLRYADRAKSIINFAVINEDPLTKRIRELQEMVEKLSKELVLSQERELEKNVRITEMTEQLMAALARGEGGDSGGGGANTSPKSRPVSPAIRQHVRTSSSSPVPSSVSTTAVARQSPIPPASSPKAAVVPSQPADIKGSSDSDAGSPVMGGPLDVLTEDDNHPTPRPFKSSSDTLEEDTEAELLLDDHDTNDDDDDNSDHHHDNDEGSSRQEEQGDLPNDALTPSIAPLRRPQQAAAAGKDDDSSSRVDREEEEVEDHREDGSKNKIISPAVGLQLRVGSTTRLPFQLQGFLLKKGRFNPAFKRRWFVLRGLRLLWYRKYNVPESLRGGLSLRGASVEEDENKGGSEAGSQGLDNPFCFLVKEAATMPLSKQWALQASSEAERASWVEALRQASRRQVKRGESGGGEGRGGKRIEEEAGDDDMELPPRGGCKVS